MFRSLRLASRPALRAATLRSQVVRQARVMTSLGMHQRGKLTQAVFSAQRPQARLLSASSSSSSSSSPSIQNAPEMFCFQCEQTENTTGCTSVGVCGKTPDVAALQDLLVSCVKGLAVYCCASKDTHIDVNRFVLHALFATVTNVNFDSAYLANLVRKAESLRDEMRSSMDSGSLGPVADFVLPKSASDEELIALGKEKHSVFERREKLGEDYIGLQEMAMYGLKGTCAYADHALQLGKEDAQIYKDILESLAMLAKTDSSVDDLLALSMKVGDINLRVMGLLDEGHTGIFGHPEPTEVPTVPVPGKALLVSGHDMADMQAILEQTEGTGVNVYTHGEMLPAHSYPQLKKFKHLVGHYGGAWQLQKFEFAQFPGSIIVTTNCLIEPRKSYKHRLFTRSAVGWPGVVHLHDRDFSAPIESAQLASGFEADDCTGSAKPLTIGFGRNAVLGVADKIIEAVKGGAISRFFLIGGCDGSEGERSYFTEIAKMTPPDSVILTLGCGKYRVNRLDLGDIGGIPRVLDMGQCNDSYSAVQVAVALAKAFETDVNGLPLSFAISWFEQKAVAVLLTLLSLGIRNIRLGPNLPGFVTPTMLNILVEKFNIMPTDNANPQADVEKMMKGN